MAELIRLQAVPATVTTVGLGGEAVPHHLVEQLSAINGLRHIYNLYGPTEDTTYSTVATLTTDRPVTVGRPVHNKRLYILDQQLQPVPIGSRGDVYVAGAGLARGYLGRPDLTAERFLPNPLSAEPGARLYRVGDVARFLPDGTIDYLGRADHQVKVRGHRVEPGEIEATLMKHASLQAAAVVLREFNEQDNRLVAYIVPVTDRDLADDDLERTLREHLKRRLPEYMVPAAFVQLEALPLTPNGKIDRRALPAPDMGSPKFAADFVAARTPAEELIASIWSQVLGIERVSVFDNFFELGGHSLLATRLLAQLAQAFQVSVQLRTLFEAPTVAELAEAIELLVIEDIEVTTEATIG
jgi:acyl-coenzyme A synthetase/AMP-(fatty) acid ligase/acyl carrier protein